MFSKHSVPGMYSIVLVDVQACKWPQTQSQSLHQFSHALLLLSFVTTADDWKCDQIHWRHYGRKKLKTDPVIMKSYHVFVDGEGLI